MKLYILRHELRPMEDDSFYVELLPEGVKNADTSLKELLNSLELDHIYSSPFIRTLQTVRPYSVENKMKIKTDYGIAEAIQCTSFKDDLNITLSNKEKKYYNVEHLYTSVWNKSSLKYRESHSQIKYRIKVFINYLQRTYENTDKNILIVTHMGIVNYILSTLSSENRKHDDHYDMGKLCTVEDGEIVYLN
tara:strand:+ start:951 stop:1523 length:573 start_codon:yes stop_codon:yes gene_type:complete